MKSNTLAEIHGRSFITPRPWSETEFDALLLKDSTFLISGENSFLLGMLTDYEAEILTLAVDPMKRRLGIAKKMLDEFEDRCLEKKINKIILEVAKDNNPALKLYESCNFEITGKRRDYYSSPEGKKIDAIIMTKSI